MLAPTQRTRAPSTRRSPQISFVLVSTHTRLPSPLPPPKPLRPCTGYPATHQRHPLTPTRPSHPSSSITRRAHARNARAGPSTSPTNTNRIRTGGGGRRTLGSFTGPLLAQYVAILRSSLLPRVTSVDLAVHGCHTDRDPRPRRPNRILDRCGLVRNVGFDFGGPHPPSWLGRQQVQ